MEKRFTVDEVLSRLFADDSEGENLSSLNDGSPSRETERRGSDDVESDTLYRRRRGKHSEVLMLAALEDVVGFGKNMSITMEIGFM